VHAVPHAGSLRSATEVSEKAGGSEGPDEAGLSDGPVDLAAEISSVAETGSRIVDAVGSVIDGKPDVIRLALSVMLAEGHLLIEDVPGVGKTMLAKALARSLGVQMRRIQFTPDLLPSDVTGVSVYDQARQEFEFRPGAVFANVVVGDEINRASPKTQSALLECMEERQVTVDGTTYLLPPPFMVIATQNPIEMEGTYPLPEAQRDRFTARVAMGYPSPAAELDMLVSHGSHSPLDGLSPVADADDINRLISIARAVHVADEVQRYVIDLVVATRSHPDLRLGASPRAALHLLRTARATAALDGRTFVVPDDVQDLAGPVLAHRLLSTAEAQIARRLPDDVIRELLARIPISGVGAGSSRSDPAGRRGAAPLWPNG
jgi:MoxR-like ATPase